MSWQPPPPPPRPGQPGQPGGMGNQQPQGQMQTQAAPKKDLNLYELLQVDRDAHPTIIRYAYRFLAAQYHPDNSETGDAEKFRIITDAWRTLSDEGKRAAYDMSLGQKPVAGAQGGGGAGGAQQNNAKKDYGLKFTKQGISFNEIELRLAILNILLSQRKKKPQTGGASAKMMMDILDMNDMAEMEFAIWYLRESGFIEMGDRLFMISVKGVDYIVDQMSKTTIVADSKSEDKIKKMSEGANGSSGNLPARV
ncbi:MAG: J domain-containing protein [Candidatus Melainabacteria bacterium]|jgi:hypothetical protein|nr:J domain-containing protein [Candidatus Melainabacteria bacterium]